MILFLVSIIKWPEPFSLITHICLSFFLQFSSIAQSCPNLCDPMNCSMPGLPVYHQLLECTQTRVHWVSDAIQPSHPLLSPFPPALNPYIPIKPFAISWISEIQTPARNSKRISIRNIWLFVDNIGNRYCCDVYILYDSVWYTGSSLWVHVTESGFVGWILY